MPIKAGWKWEILNMLATRAFLMCSHSYFIGHELTEIEKKISNNSKAISQIRRERPFNWIGIFLQAVRNLLGQEENPTLLSGDAYNEELALPLAIEVNDRSELHFLYLNKIILCYLFGDYRQACTKCCFEQNSIWIM
jgi:predicted ATPase